MLTVSDVSLSFGGKKLFDDVNLKFTPKNCYGLIGANGAGKSTFLKLISGEIPTQTGQVNLTPGQRLSILKQNQFAFDQYTALNTVLMGNEKLYNIMQEKEAIYTKEDFSDEDGVRASELEAEFAEMNGWEAESEAGILLAGLGLETKLHDKLMSELTVGEKVKVLLAQALFDNPDILLLDEPTNNLDIKAIRWLENFLLNFQNTVIVVSHDRYFLNKVCTHIADIDFGKVTIYSGNYEFWRKSSELAQRLRSDQNKKAEEKAKELKAFIQRFSANASKSKQATSRQKQLDKLELNDLPISTRKYPYVEFKPQRQAGKEILKVTNLSKTIEGEKVLEKISFEFNKGDKIAIVGSNDQAITTLFEILSGNMTPDEGEIQWGITITKDYFPSDNSRYFNQQQKNLIDWLREYSPDQDETFIRGFLGKMLFSGDEALKKTNVLSGGEKVRCMLAKLMLSGANFLMLDGPTAHLDLESITSVNEGLIRYKGSLLFSSQDHEFIQTVANRIIEIDKTVLRDKEMKYDEYLKEYALN